MSEFAPKFAFSGNIPFDPNSKIGGYTHSDLLSGKAGKIDYNPVPRDICRAPAGALQISMSQLASGLTEQRDPFYMMKTGGKYIPGKKGLGQVALEAGVGAIGGFMTGGAPGAVGGTLGSLSQNMNQI